MDYDSDEDLFLEFDKGKVRDVKRNEYISDEQVVKRVNTAVRLELEKKKAMDIPVVIYDRKTQKIFQENSDGSRVEISERLRRGRYSERVKKET